MKETNSYLLGVCVGIIAMRVKNKNFHTHRVGRLSQEVSRLLGVIQIRNYAIEKCALQQHLYPNVVKAIRDSSSIILKIEDYDKEEFLSGFFHSYFVHLMSKEG